MKVKLFFTLLLLALNLQLLAQTQATNSIVGTWKMTSFSGTNNGKPMTRDMAKFPQYKIITPTHWMYVVYSTDSLRGDGNGGTYTLKGNKYVEIVDSATTDFTVKVEGNKLMQDGLLTLADGTKLVLHEVYERVAEPTGKNADLVGTWELQSSYNMKDGKKVPDKGMSELQIITPSHYMWVNKEDGKFGAAMYGEYKREGNKITPTPTIASFPVGQGEKVEITITDSKVDQQTLTGKMTHLDGKVQEWGSVYKKAGKAKLAKVVSN
jgi:hypothetical protein